MERAHDLQCPKTIVNKSKPKSLFLPNKFTPTNQKSSKTESNNKIFNTDPLDGAMKELLNICQLYDDKITSRSKSSDSEDTIPMSKPATQAHPTTNCDKKQQTISSKNPLLYRSDISSYDSIERLQKRQSELQAQLDEVLETAKSLESKKKRKIKCILEEQDDDNHNEAGSSDEDELIEFQQIEFELRISDLNRQLDNIQEELRVRLYKRLLTNANSGCKTRQQNQEDQETRDETSLSSSSCSDEPATSSLSTAETSTSELQKSFVFESRLGLDVKDGLCHSQQVLKTTKLQITSESTIADNEFLNEHTIDPKNNNIERATNMDFHPTFEPILEYETLTPTTSRESIGSIKSSPSAERTTNNRMNQIKSMASSYISPLPHTTSPNNPRGSSTSNDLERIEEDEEDNPDYYYCNSDRFRTIYEEKLSPTRFDNLKIGQDLIYHSTSHNGQSFLDKSSTNERNAFNYHQLGNSNVTNRAIDFNNKSSFTASVSSSGNKTNRPLTLYLPKPDEEIDLVDHVQALGHDLNIISSDLKLDSTSAQGYLWKSCSNKKNKWLKRYFNFDRNSKLLSYYDNESDLVKKHSSPKNCILFDKISDVYVDHKLSGIGERDRSSKKKNYVFVLATIDRKYLLASSRAETMRAWIDILFTAAKANDYFQKLGDLDYDDFSDARASLDV